MLKISSIRTTCATKVLFIKLHSRARSSYFHILLGKTKSHYASISEQHKNNIKETQRIINRLIGKTKAPRCFSLVIDNNQLSTAQHAIANYFNNHFVSIASKLVDNQILTDATEISLTHPHSSQFI